MHNQAVLSAAAASTICFRDTNSSHQFIWASILNMHPCMSHERQHRRQTSNRMVCCTLHAAISQQPLPREKQAASFPAPNSLCDARHLPTSTHRAIHRCQATEKNAFMSRYATHQQRQRHHNLQLASVAATVLSTNTMMRWRSTTQLPVPLQYHHHQRVPKAAQCSKHHLPKHASTAMCRCQ